MKRVERKVEVQGCDRRSRPIKPRDDDPLATWGHFADGVRKRLEGGRSTYGDRSFVRPLAELFDEIEQELFDVCSWSFVAWHRLRAGEAIATEHQPRSPVGAEAGARAATLPNTTEAKLATRGGAVNGKEKAMFTFVLSVVGESKLKTIKLIRELTGFGLKQSLEIVNGAPQPFQACVSRSQAELFKREIEECGGLVEIK